MMIMDTSADSDVQDTSSGKITSGIAVSREPEINRGLASTLELLRQRGVVRRKEESGDAQQSYSKDPQLIKRDRFGRELSVKEQWKEFSRKFHGRQSGKRKTEKEQKRIKEQLQSMRASLFEEPSISKSSKQQL
ncbi:hypothetical protein MIR68_001520 [Amoeboaphelidium protococcarum]|nr:hypothetical protein MIR68_001520 [Amoeboaphelidium protococcarum]